MSAAPVDDLTDDDPVVAEYDVYLTPDLLEQIYLLQYPNSSRERAYKASNRHAPLEMRIKPNAGFVELDVSLKIHETFDKLKGIKFGEALRKAKEEGQNAFGAAAGFERMPIPPRAAGRDSQDDGMSDQAYDQFLRHFADANDKGHVMNKQTLGGQILSREPGEPMYMLGAFRGDELHLTGLSGIVQMRPQFHHLDAITHLEQSNRRRERETAEGSKPAEARGIHLTVKAADHQDNTEVASTKKLLQTAKEDAWVSLRYHDEDAPEAYAAYHEKLFVEDASNAPRLTSSLNNEQYLDAISAPRQDVNGRNRKRPSNKKQMRAVDNSESSGDADDD